MFFRTRERGSTPQTTQHRRQHQIMFSILACLMIVAFATFTVPAAAPAQHALTQHQPGKLPLAFVPNQGQTAPEVAFQANDMNGSIFLTSTDLVFALAGKGQEQPAVVRISHQNAQADTAVSGLDTLPGKVNYINGANPAQWHTGIQTYGSVMLHSLYPGVDLKYEGKQGVFEGIYYVAPGADPAQIRWLHTGSAEARLNQADGSIALFRSGTDQAVLVEQAPLAYQVIDGQQVTVPSRYSQNTDGSFSFALAAYDTSRTLVIDPTLTYSTFFGGKSPDSAESIVLDSDGNVYLTGATASSAFPTEKAMLDTLKGDEDAYVMKLDPTGATLLYSTYLGGSGDDAANALAVDATGSVYLAGETSSKDFPTKNGFQTTCANYVDKFGCMMPDAFLARLSPTGGVLTYATYLGGETVDVAEGIALGPTGLAYLTGFTASSDFPTKSAAQSALQGGQDAFVAKIDTAATSNSLVWSTLLGGSGVDLASAIVMADGRLAVTGTTLSSNFPTKNALQPALAGDGDAFITRIDSSGAIVTSTYLGGTGADKAYGLAADGAGNLYITGETASANFPTLKAVAASSSGDTDAFVTGMKADGSAWLFSTYLGGASADTAYGIAAADGADGGIYVTGTTQSGDFPLVNGLQAYKGNGDAFAVKMNPAGTSLVYATLLGGSDSDLGISIATDGKGSAYLAGDTFSANFPVKNALRGTFSGQGDVFVSFLSDAGDNPPPSETPVPNPSPIPVTPPALNPLAGSVKMASNVSLAKDGQMTYTILLNNSADKAVAASVVDPLPAGVTYVTDSVDQGGVYDKTANSLKWDASVPASSSLRLTFKVTTSLSAARLVTNKASITANGETLTRAFTVLAGGTLHEIDPAKKPVINSFRAGDSYLTTGQEITLKLTATAKNGGTLDWMKACEWQVAAKPQWDAVKCTGWVKYAAQSTWKMGSEPGLHYFAVMVADNEKNVSAAAADMINLAAPDTSLTEGRMVPYLLHFEKDTPVKVEALPSKGTPAIFVWYPGNMMMPDAMSMTAGKALEFTAPETGTYIVLVYAPKDITFTLKVTPDVAKQTALSTTSTKAAAAQSAAPAPQAGMPFTTYPLSFLGNAPVITTALPPDQSPIFNLYMPSITTR